MGCLTEGINEVIATTRNNAAPMGIIRKNDHYSMVIYRTSATAANIEKYSWVVANIVFDPLLFVQTAFSDISPDMLHEIEIEGIMMQHLIAADCWIAFATDVVNRTEEKILVTLRPLHSHLTPSLPRAINRGFYSVIEATVHATRYIITRDPGLASQIRHHGIIVKKCGSEREKEAFALLCEIIQKNKRD
ncbi:MAG: DUF447 family protein [Methanospirillaceae archaeon]|nr:DUF447 family protein [Methanospirillaceae archaeon]